MSYFRHAQPATVAFDPVTTLLLRNRILSRVPTGEGK